MKDLEIFSKFLDILKQRKQIQSHLEGKIELPPHENTGRVELNRNPACQAVQTKQKLGES